MTTQKKRTSRFTGIILVNLLVATLLLSAFDYLAKKPDFSGNWALNNEKSTLGERGGRMAANALKVTQDDKQITIERSGTRRDGETYTSTEKVTLDGKECENTVMGDRKKKSTASWAADGTSLSFSSTMKFERDGNTMEMKSVEIWKLSADGKILTIDLTSTSERGERKMTLIYDKK